MEGSVSYSKTHYICGCLPLPHQATQSQNRLLCSKCQTIPWAKLGFKASHSSPMSYPLHHRRNARLVVGCASWGPVSEFERELEAEMKPKLEQEGSEEEKSAGMGRYRHKCGERKGIVELLECLEREAIMGDDVGREPTDYSRRAQIFDRSSRLFRALKQNSNTSQSSE